MNIVISRTDSTIVPDSYAVLVEKIEERLQGNFLSNISSVRFRGQDEFFTPTQEWHQFCALTHDYGYSFLASSLSPLIFIRRFYSGSVYRLVSALWFYCFVPIFGHSFIVNTNADDKHSVMARLLKTTPIGTFFIEMIYFDCDSM